MNFSHECKQKGCDKVWYAERGTSKYCLLHRTPRVVSCTPQGRILYHAGDILEIHVARKP